MSDNRNDKPTLGKALPPILLTTVWKPGPVNGYDPVELDLVEVGDTFLVLVHCVDNRLTKKDYWDAHVIVATETGWDNADGDSWGSWDWSDVSWYLELNKENMPQL